jgi:hypothetical protein
MLARSVYGTHHEDGRSACRKTAVRVCRRAVRHTAIVAWAKAEVRSGLSRSRKAAVDRGPGVSGVSLPCARPR